MAKKAAPAHPTYAAMIAAAVAALKNSKGSSKVAISNYIQSNYKVGDRHEVSLKLAIKRGIVAGSLVQKTGTGCQGRSQDFSTGGATFSIAERSEAFVLQGTRSVPSARLTNCGAWGAAPAGSRGRAPGGGLGGQSPPDFFEKISAQEAI